MIGVLVIVLGAASGIYLGVGRSQHAVNESALVFDGAPVAAATADAALARAVEVAQQKAAAAAADAAAKAKQANDLAQRNAQESSRSQTRTVYPAPSSCAEFTGNRALGCTLLLQAGYGLDQMPCLDRLWTRESNWTTTSENKSSGAYGIPQALPGDKIAEYGADWKTNPVPQIKWGLAYIKNRYGSPCAAWGHSQDTGWY